MQSEEAPARSVSPCRFGLTPPPPNNEINVRHYHHCQHHGQLDLDIIFILSYDKVTLKEKLRFALRKWTWRSSFISKVLLLHHLNFHIRNYKLATGPG